MHAPADTIKPLWGVTGKHPNSRDDRHIHPFVFVTGMNFAWRYTAYANARAVLVSGEVTVIQSREDSSKETLAGVIAKIVRLGDLPRQSASGRKSMSGYGVIQTSNGEQYFFYGHTVLGSFSDLRTGDAVTFETVTGPLKFASNVARQSDWMNEQCPWNAPTNFENTFTRPQIMNEDTTRYRPAFDGSSMDTERQAEFRSLLRQARVEYATLSHVRAALLETLDWKTEGKTFSRKLSGIRHGLGMFCEKVDRIFAVEERDGMAQLLDGYPEFTDAVNCLMAEHAPIREVLDELTARLDECLPSDDKTFREIQRDIRQAITQLDEHMHRENGFIMNVFNTDVGVGD